LRSRATRPIVVSVGFRPSEPPRQPRLEHVRDLWQMHRPHKPQAVLTAAIYQTDTGLELRVGFSETNLIHSQLSRTGDDPLLERAEDLRLVLLGQG
jgi:hypothetical protein